MITDNVFGEIFYIWQSCMFLVGFHRFRFKIVYLTLPSFQQNVAINNLHLDSF